MADLKTALAGNIRRARKRLGMSQEDLAKRLGFSSGETVSQIELGKREVKAHELSQIAKHLLVDFHRLLTTEEIQFGPEPLWREVPQSGKERTSALLDLRSQRYRQILSLTCTEEYKELPEFEELDPVHAPFETVQRYGRKLRRILNLGEIPSHDLFPALEDRYCVMIFYSDLGDNGSALCLRGPSGCAILLNKSEAPWRRNFDCAHELYHLVTWEATRRYLSSDDPSCAEEMESRANAFASELLLPRGTVLAAVRDMVHDGKLELQSIVQIARRFDVSTAALLWRMKHLGLPPGDVTPEILKDPSFRQADRATMAEHWWTPDDLPARFVERAFIAYKQGKISKMRLATILEKKPSELPTYLTEYGLSMEFNAAYNIAVPDA